MVSVIRLLQRQRIERHTTPYRFLLARILRSRFAQSIKLLVVFAVLLAAVAWSIQGMGIVGSLTALITSAFASLVLQKILTTLVYVPKPSLACEAVKRLCSLGTLVTVGVHVASSLVWLALAILPTWTSGPTSFVWEQTFPDSASQIPAGLPKHIGHKHTPHVEWIVNEKIVYVYGLGVFAAVVYALEYVICDRRRLVFEVPELGLPAFKRLHRRARPALYSAGRIALVSTIGWLALYLLLRPASRIGSFYAGWGNGPHRGSSATTSGFPGIISCVLLYPLKYTLLILLWEAAVQIYHVYMTLGPAHRGGHTISDPSPDPNGSLVSGLTVPQMSMVKLSAWYELAVVAAHHPSRRASIFTDVDSDRIVWQQIFSAWLELSTSAVNKLREPELARKAAEKKARDKALVEAQRKLNIEPIVLQNNLRNGAGGIGLGGAHKASATAHSAPKEKVRPPSQDLYLRGSEPSRRSWLRKQVDKALQGESRAPWVKSIVTRASELRRKFLAWVHAKTLAFLSLKVGSPFRQTTARRLAELLPEPDHQILVFALRGISEMIVKSYDEDEIGYVQSTIGAYLNSVDKLLVQLEQLVGHPPVHWTDAPVVSGLEKPDVSLVAGMHAEASAAFASVSELFSPYFANLKVGAAAVNRAKKYITL